MRKAIDNYAIGKQIEVEAWEGTSIAANTRRFFCPECMESVALDIRGFFRHKNKTPQSIECDKRVDIPTKTSYEKMGLPLYLAQDIDNVFQLYIGFHPLPAILIKAAMKNEAFVEIKSKNGYSPKINLSTERFDPEHITKIGLNHMPNDEGKYEIKYYNVPNEIQNRWTSFSDEFHEGAFFKMGDQFSRKIRPLGTLITNTPYFYVGKDLLFSNFRDCMEVENVGMLKLGLHSFEVRKVVFTKTCTNERHFQSLANYLLDRYHLNLLLGESELLPLWPPCIIDDNYLIYPHDARNGLFVVESPNNNPSVYKYIDKNYTKLLTTETKPPLLCLSFSENSIPISVDKAFNGNIQFIQKQQVDLFSGINHIDFFDINDNPLQDKSFMRIKNLSIVLKSNIPCQIFHLKNNGTCIEHSLKNKDGVTIEGINNNDILIALTKQGFEILNYLFASVKPNYDFQQTDRLLAAKIKHTHGMIIPINNSVLHLYQQFKQFPETRCELEHYIKTGYVPINVIKTLLEHIGGKK